MKIVEVMAEQQVTRFCLNYYFLLKNAFLKELVKVIEVLTLNIQKSTSLAHFKDYLKIYISLFSYFCFVSVFTYLPR